MRAFLTAVAATVVFGLLAAGVLRIVQRPAYQAFSTSGVRLSEESCVRFREDYPAHLCGNSEVICNE